MSAHDNLSPHQFPISALLDAHSAEYSGRVGDIGEHLDQHKVNDYSSRNTPMPPVHLTQGDGEHVLVNGHHRAIAAARRGDTSVSAYVHQPDEDWDYPTLRPEHLR